MPDKVDMPHIEEHKRTVCLAHAQKLRDQAAEIFDGPIGKDESVWKKQKPEKATEIWKAKMPGSAFEAARSRTIMPSSFGDVDYAMMLSDMHISADLPAKERNGIEVRLPLARGDDDTMYLYTAIESPSAIVKRRDMVTFNWRSHDEKGALWLIQFSHIPKDTDPSDRVAIDDKDMKPVDDKHVRMIMLEHIMRFSPAPSGTQLDMLIWAEPSGKVPATVYNMVLKNQVVIGEWMDAAVKKSIASNPRA